MIKKFSSRIHSLLKVTKNYSTSKLYVPYNQTSDTYVIVEPYVDLENRLNNINILKNNITLRGLNINIDEICNNWSTFLNTRDELVNLNIEKKNLSEQLKTIRRDNVNEINKLKECRAKVLIRLKLLRDLISTLEKEIVIPSLSIPNTIHPECPLTESKIIFQHKLETKCNNKDCLSHLEIGKTLKCLDYINSVMVYLKNEVSLCEQAAITYFNESLEQLGGHVLFCNSDLIKSVIIEGCSTDFNDPDKTFILKELNLHLMGGASLQSFCAFLTKQSIGGNKLPLKLYTVGRLYKPFPNRDNGLFSAVQTNAIKFLIGSMDEVKAKEQFDEMLALYRRVYEDMGLDYRIVYSPVFTLENWESLRAQLELYSISYQNYIPVATLSLSGDFISKRLRMYWSSKDKDNFLHIVSGKIVDTNVLLACLLEQNISEFVIPSCLRKYMIL